MGQYTSSYTGAQIDTAIGRVVDNSDFTSADESKLDGIEALAEVNTVDSVNTATGAVVLDPDDLDDSATTNKFVTAADITNLGNLSGTNTGDNTVCTSGAATTAATLLTARTIGGVSFDGSANINLPGVNASGNQDTSGNAATVTTNANLTGTVTSTGNATAVATGAIKANMLQTTAEDLGAADVTIDLGNTNGAYVTNVTIDGTLSALNISGTNTGDNTVCTSGAATTAATLLTARTIGGVSFDGSANIDLPGVNTSGNQDTSGTASTVTNATLTTALTVDTGTVGLTGNAANSSVLTLGAGASSVSGANTGDQTLSGLGGVVLAGTSGGQTINGSTLTNEDLNLRSNAADLTTGSVNVLDTLEASDATTGSMTVAGGLAVNKRIFATDMTVTNAITGSVTGNAGTVSTITGLAPDTATTQATQPNITTATNLVTVGTIGTGTWEGTTIALNQGGTGQTTAQAAIDTLTAVAGATNEHVLTKDTATGNATFKVVPSAPVTSVNGDVGVVVLDPDDLDDTSTTNKFVTATDITNLGNLSGTNTGDQSLAGLMVNTYPLQQTAFVSKAGNDTFGTCGRIDLPFLTIQAAIDAIVDATTTKRYVVKVFAGDYAEAITMKNYVSLEGERTAACRITGTSGALVTMAAVNSRISEFSLNLTTAANGSKCIDATAGGFVLARNMDYNITSAVNGAICQFIDVDCDLLIMADFAMTATMTGSDAGVNVKRYIAVNGSTVSSIARFAMTINDDDETDTITGIYDSSTARTYITGESMTINATNAAFSGIVRGYEPSGTGTSTNTLSINNFELTSAGNGAGTSVYMVSGGAGIAEVRMSEISVTGFTTNNSYYIDTGDTLYALANVISAADGATILGTLKTFDLDETSGEFTLYGADLDINNNHIHNVGHINYTTETCEIASGILPCTSTVMVVQAESGTADNLDGVNASDYGEGDIIYLYNDVGDTITIKNNQSVGANYPFITSHGGNTIMRTDVAFMFQLYDGAFREMSPSLYVLDNYFRIVNNTDPTALMRIDATALTTGTKNLTMPNANVNLAHVNDLPVANLADGTDGELITWSAAGAPTTVAVGTATHVLTSNGVGAAPTFQAAAGGGVSIYESTVGVTVGDYETLGAAIAAGKTRVLVIADTTETGDITMPSNLIVDGIGREVVNVNMGAYNLLDNANANTDFTFEELKITFAHTSGTDPLFNTETEDLKCNRVYFDNNSSDSGCMIVRSLSGVKNTFVNCIFNLPNQSNCGIGLGNTNNTGSIISNCEFIGGGVNCDTIISGGGLQIDNVTFSGTLDVTGGLLNVRESDFNNISYYGSGAAVISFAAYCDVSNFNGDTSSGAVTLSNGSFNNFNNIFLNASSSALTLTGSNSNLSNLYVNGNVSFGTVDYNNISNAQITGTLTIGSGANHNIVNASQIVGAVSITGNNCTVSACRAGADAGGGAVTITVVAGATGTIITGTRTDAAISDSGTGTVTAGNYVY